MGSLPRTRAAPPAPEIGKVGSGLHHKCSTTPPPPRPRRRRKIILFNSLSLKHLRVSIRVPNPQVVIKSAVSTEGRSAPIGSHHAIAGPKSEISEPPARQPKHRTARRGLDSPGAGGEGLGTPARFPGAVGTGGDVAAGASPPAAIPAEVRPGMDTGTKRTAAGRARRRRVRGQSVGWNRTRPLAPRGASRRRSPRVWRGCVREDEPILKGSLSSWGTMRGSCVALRPGAVYHRGQCGA